MRYKQRNNATGQDATMREVYTFVDENTEVLEVYRLDEKTTKKVKILNVKWTRERCYTRCEVICEISSRVRGLSPPVFHTVSMIPGNDGRGQAPHPTS